jgi:hypothetical protein
MAKEQKNPAAVALALRSAKARLKSMTPAQRSEQGRRAVQARWRKAKPPADAPTGRWWGLFIVDDDTDQPKVFWSRNRDEVIARSRLEEGGYIIDVDYDPTKFVIVREFAPDVGAQVNALSVLINTEERQS